MKPRENSAEQPWREREQCERGERDQHRIMEPDVVIGIAEVGRDGDDLARAARLGRRDRGADLGMVGFAQSQHYQLPPAPPPPNDPPPPEKPPPPPPPQPLLPPPQPLEWEPRPSSFRPHSTTHGLIPPPLER